MTSSMREQKRFRREFGQLAAAQPNISSTAFLTLSQRIIKAVRDGKLSPDSKLVEQLHTALDNAYRAARPSSKIALRIKDVRDRTGQIILGTLEEQKVSSSSKPRRAKAKTAAAPPARRCNLVWWLLFFLVLLLIGVVVWVLNAQKNEEKDKES